MVASVAGTSGEMAKGGEGVVGSQCSSAARASAKVERSTSARAAAEWRSEAVGVQVPSGSE